MDDFLSEEAHLYIVSAPIAFVTMHGSCLGPWLYLAYAGTLFDVILNDISVFGFADDHIDKTILDHPNKMKFAPLITLKSAQ